MSDLFGGGDDVSTEAVQEISGAKDKTKKIRSALFKTEGGALGEELLEGEVSKRDTFFGN